MKAKIIVGTIMIILFIVIYIAPIGLLVFVYNKWGPQAALIILATWVLCRLQNLITNIGEE